jgi:integrase
MEVGLSMAKGNIRKRGNKYQITVDIGKDPVTGKRKRHYSTYDSKQEAEAAINEILPPSDNKEVEVRSSDNSDNPLVIDFLHEWLSITSRNLSPNTEYVYRKYIKTLEPYFANVRVNNIRRKRADIIINELLKKYKPSTVNKCRRLLATAFNRGVEWEEIEKNPFKGIRIRQEYREYTVWNPDDIERFLKFAKERSKTHTGNPSFFVAYMLAIHTGMRKSEILGLRWENVNLDERVISVKEAIHDLYGEGKKYTGHTKTRASRRLIAMPETLVQVLREHKTYLDSIDPAKVNYVVSTKKLGPIHQRNLTAAMQEIIKTADLPRIRFHDLRHTHASLLLANGVNAKVIQERLGHSRIDTTLNTYSHVFPSQQREAADLFDSLMKKDN